MTDATYSESARGVMITPDRARHEIEVVHGHEAGTFDRFVAEVGEQHFYNAGAVLDWLGY